MSSLVCSQIVIWFLAQVSDCCPLLPTWLLTMVACDTQKPCLNLWRPSLGCMSLFLVGLNGGSRTQLMFSPGLSGIEVVACQRKASEDLDKFHGVFTPVWESPQRFVLIGSIHWGAFSKSRSISKATPVWNPPSPIAQMESDEKQISWQE